MLSTQGETWEIFVTCNATNKATVYQYTIVKQYTISIPHYTMHFTVYHNLPQYITVHYSILQPIGTCNTISEVSPFQLFPVQDFFFVPEYWDDNILPPCGTATAPSKENITERGRGRRGGRRGPDPIYMCVCEERSTRFYFTRPRWRFCANSRY